MTTDQTPVAGRLATPRAAYVHVPFCRHRCGYCNFTVVAGRDELVSDYLRAIDLELASLRTPRQIDTLFLGGGTPSQLGLADLEQLLASLRRWLLLAEDCEFTIEVNPADVTPTLIAFLSDWGVNRLSLGAQSFDASKLGFLERDHDQLQIARAVGWAAEVAWTISLDLIFGVPGETPSMWLADLRAALELRPHHFSTYALTIERGSRFWASRYHGRLPAVGDDVEAALYELAIERLTTAGYEHYEVSNFAQPNHVCRHNLTYWNGGTYWAFGPGAASHVAGCRRVNHRSTTTYLRRVLAGESPVAESEKLPPREAALERLVFGLRQLSGVDCEEFAFQTGYSIGQLAGPAIEQLVDQGLLASSSDNLRVTRAGLMVCDSIAASLLARSEPQVEAASEHIRQRFLNE